MEEISKDKMNQYKDNLRNWLNKKRKENVSRDKISKVLYFLRQTCSDSAYSKIESIIRNLY